MKARFIQPQVNTVGLIGHWKFHEGSAFDYSLNSHSGTLKGTTLTYRYPGLDLDGTDEYIEITDHADFTPILTPFSISAWINAHNTVDFGIAVKGIQGIDAEWIFALGNDEKLAWLLYNQDTPAAILVKYDTALTAYKDEWIHVVATSDGGILVTNLGIYLNGVQVNDANTTLNIFTGVVAYGYDPRFGFVGPADYADGLIDDVMIFNVEKSAAEVKSIYETTRGRYGV